MRLAFVHIVGICAVSFSMTACGGGSRLAITEPVGRVQLGMTVPEVNDVLGAGRVVQPAQTSGSHSMEIREYSADNGRTYVVRFVDGIVRRWELKSQ